MKTHLTPLMKYNDFCIRTLIQDIFIFKTLYKILLIVFFFLLFFLKVNHTKILYQRKIVPMIKVSTIELYFAGINSN